MYNCVYPLRCSIKTFLNIISNHFIVCPNAHWQVINVHWCYMNSITYNKYHFILDRWLLVNINFHKRRFIRFGIKNAKDPFVSRGMRNINKYNNISIIHPEVEFKWSQRNTVVDGLFAFECVTFIAFINRDQARIVSSTY